MTDIRIPLAYIFIYLNGFNLRGCFETLFEIGTCKTYFDPAPLWLVSKRFFFSVISPPGI